MSWASKKTWCYSDSSEKLSANGGMKYALEKNRTRLSTTDWFFSWVEEANIPEWMTKWKHQPQKKKKATFKNGLRACLPMVCKILISHIWEEMYYTLVSRRLFPKNRKIATRKLEKQVIYRIFIRASSRKTKQCKKKKKKCSYGEDWLHKGLWYHRLSLNV